MGLQRAYYYRPVREFLTGDPDQILGELARSHGHALEIPQRQAWLDQISILKGQLTGFPEGDLFLEFAIPRMGKRADVVLLLDGVVYVIEFKVGASSYERFAIDQAVDYAVDLSNFHEASHSRPIVPILAATRAPNVVTEISFKMNVADPLLANAENLNATISRAHKSIPLPGKVGGVDWSQSPYRPTPTIIEAAQALYHGHAVTEISRSDAEAINLSTTSNCLSQIITESKERRQKSICFVTGVPGAGKTLAGLNLACSRQRVAENEHAVFLSGNGPLVEVLREALARDQVEREGCTKKEALSRTQAFIQNVHHFRDDSLSTGAAPVERVVVFDEAQRAWDKHHVAKFMAEKKGIRDFDHSEPSFLISVMDRIPDWCTIVCLVGGGQEINSGEAGIIEWFSALADKFPHWRIWCSSKIGEGDYSLPEPVSQLKQRLIMEFRPELHLGVSLRSFRSEALSAFVHHLLANEFESAAAVFRTLKAKYPIFYTRDLKQAKDWLRRMARGSELVGLLASSGAIRMKAEGINVKAKVGAADWFLNGKDDVRSCHYLEDAATEFDVQGLELDWSCVCWDGELSRVNEGWSFRQFMGTTWRNVLKQTDQRYLVNTHRVLLTRARQGMVIFVPRGSASDTTRPPAPYDSIVGYLEQCGIGELG